MNLFVLSELHPENKHVGWSVNYTFEETLASTCDATFLYPLGNEKIGFLKRYRHRVFKSWFELKDLPVLSSGVNILLIVGIAPRFLLSMHTLGPLLKQFDLRIAYLLDGFDPAHIDRSITSDLDHLFVIGAELADAINSRFSIATTFLPLATDALRLGSNSKRRSIDIIGYGRTNAALHKCLRSYYIEGKSDRTYFYSTFSQPDVYDLGEHVILLSKLLSQAQISLCFEASYLERFGGHSPILFRWFESWAAGCSIVGRKPFGKGVAPLMAWENSTLELPDDPSEWIPFFDDLLADNQLLAANSQRNHLECLSQHDWRYRLRDIFNVLNLRIPDNLSAELGRLQQKVEAQKATLIGIN